MNKPKVVLNLSKANIHELEGRIGKMRKSTSKDIIDENFIIIECKLEKIINSNKYLVSFKDSIRLKSTLVEDKRTRVEN